MCKIRIPRKSRKKNISITINNNLYELLNTEANDLEISKSKILENIIKKYLVSKGVEMKLDF